VALIAFEIFNFDTTQYALKDLLGEISFMGVMWATILAIAFCAIDFAGLVRLFTPQRGKEEPRAVWLLTAAWFLGTIANAIMTWWAVSLTLLSHEFGNEVLSRETLLTYVPIFVAMLVWLTRILFIGAFSVAGEDVLDLGRSTADHKPEARPAARPQPQPAAAKPAAMAQPTTQTARQPQPRTAQPRPAPAAPVTPVTYEAIDEPVVAPPPTPKTNGPVPNRTSRINQRPPMPGKTVPGYQARPGNKNGQSR
jgi:hypothetical protein